MANVAGFPGVQLVLAVPAADGQVTTVIVAPQTHIVQDNALAVLAGLAPEAVLSPGYTISMLELVPRRFAGQSDLADTTDTASNAVHPSVDGTGVAGAESASVASFAAGAPTARWVRAGDDLHADWAVPGRTGSARAHVEVPLRPFDALVQRAVLLVVIDLAAVVLLWGLNVTGDGRLRRWVRARAQRWAGSYRTQLTAVLFAFFVVPAVLFAVWSYRRLRSDDADQRALQVWETLRAAATGGLDALPADAQRVGTPLLLYAQGALTDASDTLFADLAPIGRFLRPDVELGLDRGNEVRASRTQLVANVPIVFGYRAVEPPGGRHVVLAAPARSDEIGLESRRTDLGILVLFTTVLGAAAALWLSGLAARQLARPIESLRRAAVAVAAGDREPDLVGNPPSEFVPVFTAFRRMAADFGESQRVLAWGEMARQVAHEIKNPLTPIRLGIQHLQRARAARRSDFDAILEQNAGRILAEIDRLDHIARAFSRYGSAPADALPPEPTDLSAVVQDVVSLERLGQAGSAAGTRAATTTTDAVEWILSGADAPISVLARSSELREVLLNVLENARLAGASRVRVTVGSGATIDRAVTGPGRESDAVAYVVVEDDGEGIPAEILPRVFEPHFSTRTSGSGLGLAVSRRIVDRWGGTIAVTSSPGTGTRVSIGLLFVGK
jgi:signal transduction histidine kinase